MITSEPCLPAESWREGVEAMQVATDAALREALLGSLALLGDSRSDTTQAALARRGSGTAPRVALRYSAASRRTLSSRAAALEPFIQGRCVYHTGCI